MIRFDIAVLALALGVTSVACGGSPTPAKDPSADPAATMPAAPENTPEPPPPAAGAPALGLGGTGTPPPQGGAGH